MPVRCRIVLVSMTKQGGCGIIYPSLMGRIFFYAEFSETGTSSYFTREEERMKVYKKLMNALAAVEKVVLVVTTLLILVLTVGNVFSVK